MITQGSKGVADCSPISPLHKTHHIVGTNKQNKPFTPQHDGSRSERHDHLPMAEGPSGEDLQQLHGIGLGVEQKKGHYITMQRGYHQERQSHPPYAAVLGPHQKESLESEVTRHSPLSVAPCSLNGATVLSIYLWCTACFSRTVFPEYLLTTATPRIGKVPTVLPFYLSCPGLPPQDT